MKVFNTQLFGSSPRTSHTISQGSKKSLSAPKNPQRKPATTGMTGLNKTGRCASCR